MNSITHPIGQIFQPVFRLFGEILAFFYGLVPNYAFAIIMLTIVIMGALTPFTVKSTKSQIAMTKLQPEIKKLQQKYKGAENRQQLNEELMKLYKEEGANPVGGCVPVLLQAPFLFILYSVIKGLSSVDIHGVAAPRYIPTSSKMYTNLVAAHGEIRVFGMDMSLKTFSHHPSVYAQLPFFAFVLIAVGLQYFQMAQVNNRSKKAGQPIPAQMQTMQRIFPIMFFYFYVIIPAAVVLYMIASTIIRILTQYVLFATGISNPHSHRHADKEVEREVPGREGEKSSDSDKPSTLKSNAAQNRANGKRKRKDR
jgi:YidC/Oxa1 family membrane protein insertase